MHRSLRLVAGSYFLFIRMRGRINGAARQLTSFGKLPRMDGSIRLRKEQHVLGAGLTHLSADFAQHRRAVILQKVNPVDI